MTAFDFVAGIEQAYDMTQDDASWLHEVTKLIAPAFGDGAAVAAYFFQIEDNDAMVGETTSVGIQPYTRDHFVKMHAVAREYGPTARAYECDALTLLSRVVGAAQASHVLRAAGVMGEDALGLRANMTPTSGMIITTPVRAGYRITNRNLWLRFAAHLGSALRLRRTQTAPNAGAVVDSSPVHATKLRRIDPHAASALWRVLVTGEWSLVDWLDHDGKRFLVAQATTLRKVHGRLLTKRERQVVACAALGHSNKLIAYDLGVSTGTVSVFLTRAAKKLGVSGRVALIRAYREGRA